MRLRARLLTAALACLLATAGCGVRSSDHASSASTPAPGATIPDDFPLSAGMGGPQDTIPTSRTGTGLRDLELCGTSPLRGLGIRDRMVADNSGGESADTRELVLLGSPDEAARVAERFADLAQDCDKPQPHEGMATTTEVVESPFGPAPTTTLLQTYSFDGEPGDGATVVHVVPVATALLVTSTYGQWTAEQARQAVEGTVEPLRATVSALAQFTASDEPTASASADPDAGRFGETDGGDVR